MVQITSFLVLALSALPFIADAAHIPSGIHHRAAIQARAASRNCARDKVPVAPPVKNLDKSSSKSSTKTSTQTSSSAESKSTSKDNTPVGGGSGGGASGGNSAIFPLSLGSAVSSFSTSSSSGKSLPLSDSTFHPTHQTKSNVYSYGSAPDGKHSLIATYKRGSISPGHTPVSGGFSFYSPTPIDLTDGNTVTMSYSVMFEKGFSFNLGGKLPGLYGGDNEEIARQCSGGRHGGGKCWSTRFMWREGGKMELYAYLPQVAANTKGLKAVPHSGMGDGYGASVGRGLFTFTPGKWATLAQRVTLNTPGKNDGSVEVYVNGKSLFVAHGLYFRSSAKSKVYGMQVQTFFGGHEREWASPKTQRAFFADFSCAVYQR